MTLLEWFDPQNYEHISAFDHLQRTGMWPQKFWDRMMADGVVINTSWQLAISVKIADAWINKMLRGS